MYFATFITWTVLFFVFIGDKDYYGSEKCEALRDVGLAVAIIEIILLVVPLIIYPIVSHLKAVSTGVIIGIVAFLIFLGGLIALTYAYSLH